MTIFLKYVSHENCLVYSWIVKIIKRYINSRKRWWSTIVTIVIGMDPKLENLQPDGASLCNFKLRFSNVTKFIV